MYPNPRTQCQNQNDTYPSPCFADASSGHDRVTSISNPRKPSKSPPPLPPPEGRIATCSSVPCYDNSKVLSQVGNTLTVSQTPASFAYANTEERRVGPVTALKYSFCLFVFCLFVGRLDSLSCSVAFEQRHTTVTELAAVAEYQTEFVLQPASTLLDKFNVAYCISHYTVMELTF